MVSGIVDCRILFFIPFFSDVFPFFCCDRFFFHMHGLLCKFYISDSDHVYFIEENIFFTLDGSFHIPLFSGEISKEKCKNIKNISTIPKTS